MIQIKRVYDSPTKSDGIRLQVERLWPRGLKKEATRLDDWLRDAAPSTALRKKLLGRMQPDEDFGKPISTSRWPDSANYEVAARLIYAERAASCSPA